MINQSSAMAPGEFTAAERRFVVMFAFLGTLFDGADFFIFTYFLVPISKYFGTSLINVTVIQATSYLAGIIGGMLFGVLADRWGRRAGLAHRHILTVGCGGGISSPHASMRAQFRHIA